MLLFRRCCPFIMEAWPLMSVQSVLSLSHPVWIFLQRLFLSLFPEPPESSGLISPVTTYSGVYDSHACMLSRVQLFVTPWTVAHQGPPSMEFSRPEYWKCEVKGGQSCLTLCNPMDYVYSPWNSPGQNTASVKWKSVSHVWLFATPWTMYTVHGILQARILEYWSG